MTTEEPTIHRPVPDLVLVLRSVFSLTGDRRRWDLREDHQVGKWHRRSLGLGIAIDEPTPDGWTLSVGVDDRVDIWKHKGVWKMVVSWATVATIENATTLRDLGVTHSISLARAKDIAAREGLTHIEHKAANAIMDAAVLRASMGGHQL